MKAFNELTPLRLDLQYFSEEPAEPKDPDPVDPPAEPNDPEPKTGGDPEPNPEGKTFTQAEIDRIVKERLERDRKKREAEAEKEREAAEKKRLEEKEEYKELYEKLQKEREADRLAAIESKKESLLAKAGYDESQVERYTKYLSGETDEELHASLESLKADVPTKKEKQYGDPSPGNGSKQPPKKKDLEEKGRSVVQRLKAKGKIKGRKS
jgi:hypothetical protein